MHHSSSFVFPFRKIFRCSIKTKKRPIAMHIILLSSRPLFLLLYCLVPLSRNFLSLRINTQGTTTTRMSQMLITGADDEGNATTSGDDGWVTVPKGMGEHPSDGPASRSSRRRNNKKNDQWSGDIVAVEEFLPKDFEDHHADSSSHHTKNSFEPFLLLLAGLPGSGKSTFARALVEAMPHKYARVNQDEMKSRKICVSNAKQFMSDGLSVIVDRCNFDFSQRKVWYDLAAEHKYRVDCVVLMVPPSLCIQRCQQRTGHETIQPNEASKIVGMVQRQWKMPGRDEQLKYHRNFQVLKSSQQFNDALILYLNHK